MSFRHGRPALLLGRRWSSAPVPVVPATVVQPRLPALSPRARAGRHSSGPGPGGGPVCSVPGASPPAPGPFPGPRGRHSSGPGPWRHSSGPGPGRHSSGPGPGAPLLAGVSDKWSELYTWCTTHSISRGFYQKSPPAPATLVGPVDAGPALVTMPLMADPTICGPTASPQQ